MSTTSAWSGIAIALFFAMDVLVVLLIFLAVRRKNRYRGFEVTTQLEQDAPVARKD